MTTTLRAADGRTEIAVNEVEKGAAVELLPRLLEVRSGEAHAAVDLPVPAELLELLRRVVGAAANGERLTIGTLPTELTTSVAAQQLGISRPTLMRLVESGKLASHKVGTHTRIKTADVVAFRKMRLQQQREAFEGLRALDEELGLD